MVPTLRRLDWSGIKNWDALESAIAALPSEQQRGEAFEEFCIAFLTLEKDYFQAEKIWRFRDTPSRILAKLGSSSSQDAGIDGVLSHHDGTITAYQAKYRASRSDIPSQRELSTFYMVSDRADFRLIISNVDDLPRVAKERKAHGQILVDFLLTLDHGFFDSLREYVCTGGAKLESPPPPKPFQEKAIEAVLRGFINHPRGQAVLPCGSGKTLLGKWIADRMEASRILVMVPSLALIRQTLYEWYRARSRPFHYICICSDDTVAYTRDGDGWETTPSELEIRVSTKKEDLKAFLMRREDVPQVVFSTYQSGPVLVEGLKDPELQAFSFDLTICDEAHRVAGVAGRQFSQVLHDNLIRSHKRLFLTATPRVVAPHRQRKADQDVVPLLSMDDEAVFGPTFYRFNFAEAINEHIICDYRIVVIGVSEEEITQLVRAGGKIETDDLGQWDAEGLAQRIALAKALSHYGIKKVFSFHNRVQSASRFVDGKLPDGLPVVLRKMDSTLQYVASHINGEMSTALRNRILREFALSPRGVISNARCLGEGVNVPIVDGIFFADPRDSVIDIVQATGRALRMAPGKERAYVIIPVLVHENEEPEVILEESRFGTVWNVLSAMLSQDDRLEASIQAARIRQGEGTAPILGQKQSVEPNALPDASTILVGFPKHISFSKYQSLFSLEMMEQLGERWYLKFGALKKYMAEHGDEPGQDTEYEGFKLGSWLAVQRGAYKKGKLPEERKGLLSELGIQWSAPDDNQRKWDRHMAACIEYLSATGKLPVVPEESPDGLKIGQWLANQRRFFKEGRLRKERKQALEKFLGPVLDLRKARQERNLAAYKDYVEKAGTQPERRTIHNGIAIGNWLINTVRPNKDKLPPELVQKLDALGFQWVAKRSQPKQKKPQSRRKEYKLGASVGWFKSFDLCRNLMRHLDSPIRPGDAQRNLDVGTWFLLEKRLHDEGLLSPVRRVLLETLILMDAQQSGVERGWCYLFSLCQEFLMTYPDELTNDVIVGGMRIGEWFQTQVTLCENRLLLPTKERLIMELMRFSKQRAF